MFSGISPNYQLALKEELFGCFKYIHIPFESLMKMPVKDRRYFIKRHNELAKEEEAQLNGEHSTFEGEAINSFTDIDQNYGKNAIGDKS
jgi:hypothetical protein